MLSGIDERYEGCKRKHYHGMIRGYHNFEEKMEEMKYLHQIPERRKKLRRKCRTLSEKR